MGNKTYHVKYKESKFSDVHGIDVLAENKNEAYVKATFESIPERFGINPYSTWVHSVTYSNGSYRIFDTFEGKPF